VGLNSTMTRWPVVFCAALVKAPRQLSLKNCVVASSGQPISSRPCANRITTRSSNHLRVLAGSRVLTRSSMFVNIWAVSGIVRVFPLYFHQCGMFAGVTPQTTVPPSYCPTGNSLPTLQVGFTLLSIAGRQLEFNGCGDVCQRKIFGNAKKL